MSKQIKVIKVNATAHTVTEVEIEDTLEAYYREIGCELITAAYPKSLTRGDCIFVDDEGLLHEPKPFFMYTGYPQPLAGNGLIVGVDEDGNTVSPKITLPQARARIWFQPH